MTKSLRQKFKKGKRLFAEEKNNFWYENIKTITIAILIAAIFRSLILEPYHIPSGSMKSGLQEGDFILVKKYSYGYSKYSFPFAMIPFSGRIFNSEPKRGDVIIFRQPKRESISFIKRLVGLPGDKIQMINGVLHINNEAVKLAKTEDFYIDNGYFTPQLINEYQETLPNGVSYNILDQYKNSTVDNTPIYEVPAGHYFVMGDNRDNSQDSRFQKNVGFIPKQNITGKAWKIFMSSDESLLKFWKWPSSIQFSRIFKDIK